MLTLVLTNKIIYMRLFIDIFFIQFLTLRNKYLFTISSKDILVYIL